MKNNYKAKNLSFFKSKIVILLLIGVVYTAKAQSPSVYIYTGTTQNWICPKGVTSIQVEAIGGGAGGRTTANTNGHAGGGGGGGAYAKRNTIIVVPGTTYTISSTSIGNGGAANTAGGITSVIINGVTITAAGGSIGAASATGTVTGGNGGTVAASLGDAGVVFAGGNGGFGLGTTGPNAGSGGGGGSAAGSGGSSNPGGNAASASSPGAGGLFVTNYGGAGGTGGNNAIGGAASTAAGNYGGGGGGAGHKNNAGGSGRTGAIIITFSCPTETAAAGSDQTVCAATANLAGNTPVTAGLTGGWTLVSGTGTITAPTSPTSGITGLTLGATATFRWTINNGQCGTTSDDVIITRSTTPTTVITPSPTTGATGICYSGSGALTGISWTASANATSYDVYFGTAPTPVTLSANVSTNSYTTVGLLASTTYYWRIVAKNACGTATTSATWSFTTKSAVCYCTPTASSGVHGTGITNVSYSTVNNTTSNTIVYNDYTALIGNVVQGANMPISITTATSPKIYNIQIWVDWNNDGDFVDVGEGMFTGIVNSNTINGTINVALTATLGQHRMRVGIAEHKNGAGDETPIPCFSGTRGAFEDYTINVTADVCVGSAPTVSTNPANSSVANGSNTSFTATFANTPTNYIWEVSSDGGVNYTTITNGGVYSGATTATLTITGVTAGMNNFKYRVSASNACGTSAVSSSATLTVTVTYCAAGSTTSLNYISGITSEGNLNDVANVPTTYSAGGYGNYSSIIIATQIPGGGINISINLVGATGQFIRCYVDWNGNGLFSDVGDDVYTSGNTATGDTSFGFVVPVSQAQGNYRMRIRTEKFTNSVTAPTLSYCGTTITSGETEDYTIAVVPDCAARIQSVASGSVCGANNTVTISSVGLGGTTQYRWYTALTGGAPQGTSTNGSYTTPPLSSTTYYYVTAFNGSCESLVRTKVNAKIVPTTSISFTPTAPATCGESIITITAASDIVEEDLFTEDFEGATVGFTVTIPTNTNGGVDTPWSVKTSTYQPTTTSVWRPAINSGSVGSNFGFTTSDYANSVIQTRYTTTSAFDATSFINLTLTFNHYYSYYGGDSGKVQVSTDGGTVWTNVAIYNSDLGSASKFKTETINLTAYIGFTNIKLRFEYTAGWDDGWAIDDIRFFGTKQLNTSFTWSSGTPISGYTNILCTLPYLYTNQVVSTIYLKPDITELISLSYPVTVTATLANGCPISQLITVTNNSKIWDGGTPGSETKWEEDANWKPNGVPTASNCIIIPNVTYDPIISGTSYDAFGKNILVKSGGNLTVNSDNNITISDEVVVDSGGLFDIKNNASLLQTNDAAINSGSIKMTRTTRAMTRFAYVYAGSPIAENAFSQLPSEFDLKYRWTSGTMTGAWVGLSSLTSGEGFIARVRNIAPFTSGTGTIDFVYSGTPKNGVVNLTLDSYDSSSLVAGNTVLLSNPYPSAISASSFLTNSNNTELGGILYFWTSVTLYSGSGPYSFTDYASWNLSGGVGNAPSSDPANISLKPNGKIAAGQGFFAQVFADGPITFNDNMRVPDFNSQFFKAGNVAQSDEKNRIWLNLYSDTAFRQTLVGYINNATNGFDRLYDGDSFTNNEINVYSLLNNRKLVIQAKALPFDENDIVPLGYKITNGGTYSISIDELDGIFSGNQNVYLRDNLLQLDHNLKLSPYSFTTSAGIFDNRFEIVYVSNALGTNNPGEINTFATISNHIVTVESSELIKEISLYDITGKLINNYSLAEFKKQFTDAFNYPNGIYIAKITLDNDAVFTKKLIH